MWKIVAKWLRVYTVETVDAKMKRNSIIALHFWKDNTKINTNCSILLEMEVSK